MIWTVYALREPGSAEVRYIGFTKALGNRLNQHRTTHRRVAQPTLFSDWLRDSNFELVELVTFLREEEARACERHMIVAFSALDHRLFNHKLMPAEKRIPLRG